MKERKGFVSNSSSSSFIVALDKPFEKYSDEEIKFQILNIPIDSKEVYDGLYDKIDSDELVIALKESRIKKDNFDTNDNDNFDFLTTEDEYGEVYGQKWTYDSIHSSLKYQEQEDIWYDMLSSKEEKDKAKKKMNAIEKEIEEKLKNIALETNKEFIKNNSDKYLTEFELGNEGRSGHIIASSSLEYRVNHNTKNKEVEHSGDLFSRFDFLYESRH